MTSNIDPIPTYDVHFTIDPKCNVINLVESNTVKFDIEQVGKVKKLVGFHILVTHTDEEESQLIAIQQALRLCNLMSLRYRLYIKPTFSGISKVKSDGNREVTKRLALLWAHIKELNFDMKDNNIIQSLQDDTTTKVYHHIAKGIKAYHEKDYPESIREFYQVVEQFPNHFSKLIKYAPLRNALSHFGNLFSSTINELNSNFGNNYFTLTSTNSFDYTSPSNLKKLGKEADVILTEIINFYDP